jgi:hypothetical protein
MAVDLTPVETRAQDADFVIECGMSGLKDRLPLLWPVPPDVPSLPKNAYRSHYAYLGWDDAEDPQVLEHFSDFEVVLRLVDFDPLRPVLAQRLGWTSARGWDPFDPVSIFLLLGWQITNGWNRAETLRNLRHPRYADLALRFGFEDGVYPTEGGMRHWLTTISDEIILLRDEEENPIAVAVQFLNQLIAQSVDLLVENGFLSQEAWKEAFVCPDGMLTTPLLACVAPLFVLPATSLLPPTTPAPVRLRKRDARGATATPPLASMLPPGTPRLVSSGTLAPTNLRTAPTDPPTMIGRVANAVNPAMGIAACPFRFPIPTAASASSCSTISCQPMPARRTRPLLSCPSSRCSIHLSPATPSPVTLALATKCS